MQLTEFFSHVGSDAKGKYQSPTAGSTEWNQWLSWANEELYSFGEVHDWPELTNHNFSYSSIAASGTSIGLPSNFKKFAGPPNIEGKLYQEVDGDMFTQYASTDKVFRHGFDGGWFIELRSPLTSTTTVIIPLISYPTSLSTTSDNINVRNPMYLVKRVKTRVFKYRQDPIFTELETEATIMLGQMLENEFYKHSQYKGGAVTREEEAGFTLGED
jgi:hypothetical protein